MTVLAEALAVLACIEWRSGAVALMALARRMRQFAPSHSNQRPQLQGPDPADAP